MNKKALAKAMMATFCTFVSLLAVALVIIHFGRQYGPIVVVGPLVLGGAAYMTCEAYYKHFKKQM